MSVAFFISSVGDTDLAKATILKMRSECFQDKIYLISITDVATKRVGDLAENNEIIFKNISEILQQNSATFAKQLKEGDEEKLSNFALENNIHRAYIGVPSPVDEQIPFQIANALPIPCTIVYEFMFKPNHHSLWSYAGTLAKKQNIDFAVTLPSAKIDIPEIEEKAAINVVGHLSIDRAVNTSIIEKSPIKKSL